MSISADRLAECYSTSDEHSRARGVAVAVLWVWGAFAALVAVYLCGHTELVCVRVSANRVDARYATFHWFDLVSHEEFDVAGIIDATASSTNRDVCVSNGGDVGENTTGTFPGNADTATTINQFIASSGVGQRLVMPNSMMKIEAGCLALISIASFRGARKFAAHVAIVMQGGGPQD